MKIEDRNPAAVSGSRRSKGSPQAAGNARAAATGQAPGDHVEVSTSSRYLSAVQASEEAFAARHASKLAALATEVSDDSYQINAQAVSDRIIQEHLRAA